MAKNKNINKQEGIVRILNCEAPATLELGEKSQLSEVQKLGWSEVDMSTGEILRSVPSAMHPIPQIGTPRIEQEVGEPILIPLSKPSDLKRRILELLPENTSIQDLYGEPTDTTEDFNNFCASDDDEVDAFNKAMECLPSFCDENGYSNFERNVANNKEEVADLENFMAHRAQPAFQTFLNMSPEEREAVIASFNESRGGPSNVPPKQEPENGNEG